MLQKYHFSMYEGKVLKGQKGMKCVDNNIHASAAAGERSQNIRIQRPKKWLERGLVKSVPAVP